MVVKACLNTLQMLEKEYSLKKIFEIICSNKNRIAAEYLDAEDNIHSVTYTQYYHKVRACAASLSFRLSGKEGSFVALKMKNSPSWPVVFWGLLMAGFKPLLIDAKAQKELTLRLMGQAGAGAIISDGTEKYESVKWIDAEALLSEDEKESFVPSWEDEIALCTSGTMGTSKVFVYNGFAVSKQIENAKYFINSKNPVMFDERSGQVKNLAFLPFHHIFGLVAVYLWFSFFGKTIVYLRDKETTEGILETCRVIGVTHIFCVPLFWNSVAAALKREARAGGEKQERKLEKGIQTGILVERIFKNKGAGLLGKTIFKSVQDKLFGHKIRLMINGGGRVSEETLRLFNGIGYPLTNGFGMTEGGILSAEFSNDVKVRVSGTVGSHFCFADYKIERDDLSKPGEVLIKGDSLHTAQMKDGSRIVRTGDWYSTGDIGHLDEKNRLFLDGRLKDVIIGHSGENIYPDELEEYFSNLPYISHFVVLGMNTADGDEMPVLVLEPERQMDGERAKELLTEIDLRNNSIPIGKRIGKILISSEPLPLASGIKVQRVKVQKEIREATREVIELTEQISLPMAETEEIENSELVEEVRNLFAEELNLSVRDIPLDAAFVGNLGGNSLSLVSLRSTLEQHFSIQFNNEEPGGNSSVSDFVRCISQKEIKRKDVRNGRVFRFEDTGLNQAEYVPDEAEMKLAGLMGVSSVLLVSESEYAFEHTIASFLSEDDLLICDSKLGNATWGVRSDIRMFRHGDENELTAELQDADHDYGKVLIAILDGEDTVAQGVLDKLKNRYRAFVVVMDRGAYPGSGLKGDLRFARLPENLGNGYVSGNPFMLEYISENIPNATIVAKCVREAVKKL